MSEHAIANARAWLAEIVADVAAMEAADREGEHSKADELRDAMQEKPLSLQVRDGWYAPGSHERGDVDEYEILLTTGGPALRIWGEIGSFGRPDSAELQWQDWGTPWTIYGDSTAEQDEALLAYASLFYWGD